MDVCDLGYYLCVKQSSGLTFADAIASGSDLDTIAAANNIEPHRAWDLTKGLKAPIAKTLVKKPGLALSAAKSLITGKISPNLQGQAVNYLKNDPRGQWFGTNSVANVVRMGEQNPDQFKQRAIDAVKGFAKDRKKYK